MSYDHYKTLLTRREENILLLSLNRPDKLNSWNNDVIAELYDVTTKLRQDRSVSVVILTGEGEKGFSGGMDIKNVFTPEVYESVENLYDVQLQLGYTMMQLRQMPQVIIAACHGNCVGGGFILAMASDLRIIADNSRFSAPLVKVKMGGGDLGTSYFLPRMVGASVASDLLLTGRYMYPEEAVRLGFANACVSREELMTAAWDKARELARTDRLILQMTKEVLNINVDVGGLETALMVEHRNQQQIFSKLWR